MKKIPRSKLMWIAGLLEGEGCFLLSFKQSAAGPYPVFRVSCCMCDGDVIERLAKWVGAGRRTGPRVSKNPKHRPVYYWSLYRRDQVRVLLNQIRPFMGKRRTAKIDEILKAIRSTGRPLWRHGTVQGYSARGCRCNPCRAANAKKARAQRMLRRTNIAGYARCAELASVKPVTS